MSLKSLGIASVLAVAATAFVIGTSPAKAAGGGLCTLDWKPVCAVDHGFTHTFSNACWAKLSGAKILYKGECGMKPKAKHHHKAMKKAEKKEEKKK